MKLLSRITAAATLLAPAAFGSWVYGPQHAPSYAFRPPVTRAALQARGSLNVVIPAEAWFDLLHRPDSNHFDYDLLVRFASELGVALRPRPAATADDAVRQLESGWADLAVLPANDALPGEVDRTAPCALPSDLALDAPDETPTLALFARRDSVEMFDLLNGAVLRLARSDDGGGLFEHYCFEQSFARAEPAIEPVARKIAHYARIMAKYADEVGLDWKLVAALIYEESRFKAQAVSSKGARGLMQLMPWVGGEVGVRNVSEPEANIRAGILYLGRLAEMFPEATGRDRLSLVLASYLIGPGHVFDAREIARQMNLDPDKWHGGLEEVLPLLETPRYFARTRAGYAQGRRAVLYVNSILDRYQIYRAQIGAPAAQTARLSATTARPS